MPKKMASQSENSGMELLLYSRDLAVFLFLKALVQRAAPVYLALTRKHSIFLDFYCQMDSIHINVFLI